MNHLAVLPGVESVTPISKPFKLTSREFHPGRHRRPGGRHDHRRRDADGHGGSLLRREPRPAAAHGGRGGRRPGPPSCVAGPSSRAPAPTASRAWAWMACASWSRPVSGRAAHRHRGHGARPGGGRGASRGHPPGRRPQHAELPAAHGGRPRASDPVMLKRGISATIEEWLMAAEYIVSLGQPAGHPLRAGHPHLRDVHAQHARPDGRAAAAPAHAPARHRGSRRTPPASAGWCRPWPWRPWPAARTASWSRCTPTPTTPSPTGSSR